MIPGNLYSQMMIANAWENGHTSIGAMMLDRNRRANKVANDLIAWNPKGKHVFKIRCSGKLHSIQLKPKEMILLDHTEAELEAHWIAAKMTRGAVEEEELGLHMLESSKYSKCGCMGVVYYTLGILDWSLVSYVSFLPEVEVTKALWDHPLTAVARKVNHHAQTWAVMHNQFSSRNRLYRRRTGITIHGRDYARQSEGSEA